MEDAAAILFLAVVATLITTAVIGFALWPFAQVPLVVCLLLGAVVATTGALRGWLKGEVLLNDAAAISLFVVLLAIILSGREPQLPTRSRASAKMTAAG
jgi:CPA1 family monovalent cation:H+ antiporter